MASLTGLLAMGAGLLLVAAFKKWGRPYLKKMFDDPNTPEDESAPFVKIGEDVLKAAAKVAVEKAMDEAKKNKHIDPVLKAAESLHGQFAGSISLEDAKKLVSAAMK